MMDSDIICKEKDELPYQKIEKHINTNLLNVPLENFNEVLYQPFKKEINKNVL